VVLVVRLATTLVFQVTLPQFQQHLLPPVGVAVTVMALVAVMVAPVEALLH
jgi:hypothetical protein